jgi:hypothetical protein
LYFKGSVNKLSLLLLFVWFWALLKTFNKIQCYFSYWPINWLCRVKRNSINADVKRGHPFKTIITKFASVKFGSCFWRFEISKQARKAHKMLSFYLYIKLIQMSYTFFRGRWDHDRMVVGFITTYAISAYHHKRCEFESSSGEVYSIQYYVIKFVSDSRQVGGFLQVLQFPSPIKLTAMIELGLNTINQTNQPI